VVDRVFAIVGLLEPGPHTKSKPLPAQPRNHEKRQHVQKSVQDGRATREKAFCVSSRNVHLAVGVGLAFGANGRESKTALDRKARGVVLGPWDFHNEQDERYSTQDAVGRVSVPR
jgi:hypothetical protein